MKGLILKDFYTSVKELRSYFVIMALFIVASFISEDMYFCAVYPCILCGMFPQSLISFDERSKWENYCGTLPVKKADIVSSKYIFTMIVILITAGVSAIAQAIRFIITDAYALNTYTFTVVAIFVFGCIAVALQLPFVFKCGAEKGRIGYWVMVVIASAGSTLSGNLLTGNQQIVLSNGLIWPVLCIAAIIFYGLSWLISIKYYTKRDIA